MTDEIRGGIGNGADDGVVRRPRLRGHVKLGTRMWARIQREFAAGASVPWLSARYGAGERTIAMRAKTEGWRRKDLAEAADAELEAAEARGDADPVAGPAIGAGLGLDGSARKEAEAFEAALAGVDQEARDGAAREAMNRAVACMRREDAPAAMGWAKLAAALDGMGRTDGAADEGADEAMQDAAMAVLCERLGLSPSPCTPATAGVQITGAD
ncbi:hypothetical protein BrevBR_06950 [Brevundimonas sp. BR2-1]|uniref:hypothetical protein n=1 Tax=Brevundimonas sp. BR2-1 TaxID=3031123 RepID=UPI00309A4268